MRILFIDDKVANFQNTIKWLNRNGHHAEVTSNIDGVYKELCDQINQLKYDLVFIDDDFEDISYKQYSIGSGADLIEKLSIINRFCPIIYFSGAGPTEENIANSISKYGTCQYRPKNLLIANILKEIDDLWKLENVKKVIEHRKETLETELFNYVLNMDYEEKASWYQETEKGEGANWENFMVKIFNSEISVKELFVSAYPTITDSFKREVELAKDTKEKNCQSKIFGFEISIAELSISGCHSITNTFLINIGIKKLMLPTLNKGLISEFSGQIKKYITLNDSERYECEVKISSIALNYFLNILFELEKLSDASGKVKSVLLSHNRKNSKATSRGTKDDDLYSLFLIKLALRRVYFALFYLDALNKLDDIELHSIHLYEDQICRFFQNGEIVGEIDKLKPLESKNVTNRLGIDKVIVVNNTEIFKRKDLFDDEKKWLIEVESYFKIYKILKKVGRAAGTSFLTYDLKDLVDKSKVNLELKDKFINHVNERITDEGLKNYLVNIF